MLASVAPLLHSRLSTPPQPLHGRSETWHDHGASPVPRVVAVVEQKMRRYACTRSRQPMSNRCILVTGLRAISRRRFERVTGAHEPARSLTTTGGRVREEKQRSAGVRYFSSPRLFFFASPLSSLAPFSLSRRPSLIPYLPTLPVQLSDTLP